MSIARQFRPIDQPKKTRRKGAGRPRKADAMVVLNIRIEPEVLVALRSSGKGWQDRARDALRKAAGL